MKLTTFTVSLSLLLLASTPTAAAFQPSGQRPMPPRSRQQTATRISDYAGAATLPSTLSGGGSSGLGDATTALNLPSVFESEVPASSSSSVVAWTEVLGEAFGTFWIVGIGSLASMSATFGNPLTLSLQSVATVWAAAVTSAILITTPLSGAHLNPAMTLAMSVFRGFPRRKVLPFVGAQLAGAMAGSAAAFGLFANVVRGFEQAQGLLRPTAIASARVFGEYFDPSLVSSAGQAMGIEALGTALLATVVFSITHKRNETPATKKAVPFVVGGTVFSLINALAPFTQCGMNPARDFGPRIIAYLSGWTQVAFQDCWLYIAGPILGALAGAALVDKVLYATRGEPVKENPAVWM